MINARLAYVNHKTSLWFVYGLSGNQLFTVLSI